jgi:hypothetical protein
VWVHLEPRLPSVLKSPSDHRSDFSSQ